ncbi:MAG: hypothetical protein HP496_05660 [Nitrospira sp.]|nr:hypothetical protein [Nitrospira sp.]
MDINSFNRLRDDEVEVRVALSMRIGSQVDRHPIKEETDVRPMVCVEASKKVLIGFPRSARMLNGHKAWDQPKDLRRTSLRLQDNLFVRDELLRRRRHRFFTEHGHFRHFQLRLVATDGRHQTHTQGHGQ